jgi:hypothetical protein
MMMRWVKCSIMILLLILEDGLQWLDLLLGLHLIAHWYICALIIEDPYICQGLVRLAI